MLIFLWFSHILSWFLIVFYLILYGYVWICIGRQGAEVGHLRDHRT